MPGLVWVALGVTVITVLLLLQFRWHWYVLQYLFFTRFPIAIGALLFFSFLGADGLDVDPSGHWVIVQRPFHNLFVLGTAGLWLVPFLAILASWTIVNAALWIYAEIPNRVGLPLWGYRKSAPQPGTGGGADSVYVPARIHKVSAAPGSGTRRYAVYALLAGPLIVCVTCVSPEPLAWKLGAVAGSIFSTFVVRWLVLRAGQAMGIGDRAAGQEPGLASDAQPGDEPLARLAKWPSYQRLEKWLVRVFGERSHRYRPPELADNASLDFTERNVRIFLGFTGLVYLVLLVLLWPGSSDTLRILLQNHVPALAYALLLMMLLTWVLAWISLKLDGYRVPVELATIVVVAMVYRLADTDHYYEVERAPASHQIAPSAYLRAWQDRRPGLQPIVVLGSGGGISASAWVAMVLAGLQDLFHDRFAQSIALISTTSGGSVGAMYYVDSFKDPGKEDAPPISPPDTSWVVQMASRSSLGAMAWGLIYPDFARLFIPTVAFRTDRGWALERRWAQPLAGDDRGRRVDRKLSDWSAGVAAGWQPAQVFNATFTETGRRLLISSLAIHGRGRDPKEGSDSRAPWDGRDFAEYYEDADLPIVTAARLSAAFPFVTPVARPTIDGLIDEEKAYHVADGGYFDNFGVMSAIEFIRKVTDPADSALAKGRKILVLEIRIGNSSSEKRALPGEGFRMEVLGPLETLMAVRSTSQLERNNLELRLLRAVQSAVVGSPVAFELRTPMPESWHLSDQERDRICAYWMARCEHNQAAIRRVAVFLGEPVPERPAESKAFDQLCEDQDAELPEGFRCPWAPR